MRGFEEDILGESVNAILKGSKWSGRFANREIVLYSLQHVLYDKMWNIGND